MKFNKIYCRCCKKETTFIRKSNQSTGETIFLGILTAGAAFATREFWWECVCCENKIYE